MKIPYVIEGCPFSSEYGIRLVRDPDVNPRFVESGFGGRLCDVVKIQYAITLEKRAIAAELKVVELTNQMHALRKNIPYP